MNRKFLTVFAITLTTTSALSAFPIDKFYVTSNDKKEVVSLGMPFKEIVSEKGAVDSKQIQLPSYKLNEYDYGDIIFYTKGLPSSLSEMVMGIKFQSKDYRTFGNLGVGCSGNDVIRILGKPNEQSE